MNDLLLFTIGCAVSLLFLGGMLIHMVAGQKIADVEKGQPDRSNEGSKRSSAKQEPKDD